MNSKTSIIVIFVSMLSFLIGYQFGENSVPANKTSADIGQTQSQAVKQTPILLNKNDAIAKENVEIIKNTQTEAKTNLNNNNHELLKTTNSTSFLKILPGIYPKGSKEYPTLNMVHDKTGKEEAFPYIDYFVIVHPDDPVAQTFTYEVLTKEESADKLVDHERERFQSKLIHLGDEEDWGKYDNNLTLQVETLANQYLANFITNVSEANCRKRRCALRLNVDPYYDTSKKRDFLRSINQIMDLVKNENKEIIRYNTSLYQNTEDNEFYLTLTFYDKPIF